MRSKSNKRGNSDTDEAFINHHLMKGTLRVLEADEDLSGLPYAARYVFEGDEETIGSFWVMPSAERRCTGMAYLRDDNGDYVLKPDGQRMKRPCTRWSIVGGKVCIAHGGGVPVVRMAAQERLLLAADALTGALLRIAFDEGVDPSDRIRAINSALDRCNISGEVRVVAELKPYEEVWQRLMKPEEKDGTD